MTRPGPKPTPTNLRNLHGVKKLDRSRREPKPKVAVPPCPRWLSAAARAEWRWIAPKLARLKIIGEIDRQILILYCTAAARFREAEEKLREEPCVEMKQRRSSKNDKPLGPDYPHWSPWLAVSNKARQQCHQALAELGLTPSARTRLITPDNPNADDPLGLFD